MGRRDDQVKAMKAAAITLGKRSAKAGLLASAWGPFFGLPFVSQATDYLLNWCFTYAVDQGEMQIFFWWIDMRTVQQGADFEAAALRNVEIQKTGSKDEKKKSEEALWNMAKPLLKLNQ